jgi:glycerol-3-phosphate O-acyltransferase
MNASPDSAGSPDGALLPDHHGTGMLRRFGWLYGLLGFGARLARVRVEEHSVDRVREASERGPVVYVLQHTTAVDHLALNAVLNRRRLPLSVWSNGANSLWWLPVRDAWRALRARLTRQREPAVDTGWLASQIVSGQVITLFLDTSASGPDPFDAVIEAQRHSDRPIQLVPIVVLWTRAPKATGQVRNFLLGRRDAPGPLGQLRDVWFRSDGALLQAGEPLDVASFLPRVAADEAATALRRVLRRFLVRESRVVQGPRLLPYADMQRAVLDNPPMRELAQREASTRGVPIDEVRREMVAEYRKIASRFRWWVVRVSDVLMRPIWTRVFNGVDARPEDIERIRAAMRRGSLVLVPCHKSHADYVLITWVFYQHDLIIPHVITGDNLAIWPLSSYFRSVGGFFIKRSFSGEHIHPAVFARYLRELIFHGYPVEFFIEGGRSRSGKLLPPRVGVLGMVFDAAERRPHDQEVTLLPISLAYEEVAEEGAYVREAGGEDKRPETMGQLVKARSVLKRRFGRVYLRVGEPIPCSGLVDASEGQPTWSDRAPIERKSLLVRVAERVMHRIAAVTVVLPTSLCAAALLAHHRRGVRHVELTARLERFRTFLLARSAQEASSMVHFDLAVRTALDRFARAGHVSPVEHEGERLWNVEPGSRIGLEFYKNQILQFFVPAGLVAMALRALPDAPQRAEALVDGVAFLVWTWRREFRFDPDGTVGELVRDGLAALDAHGALRPTDEGWVVADAERVGEIHALFRNFAEAYLLVLRSIDEGATSKGLPKSLVARSEALLASGAVTRPESLSVITLQNAVAAFVEAGALSEVDGQLGRVEERCADAVARLAPMVE